MIFKTFDSDSDKFISKIGVLNRSFEQWGEAIRARKLEVTELMDTMGKKSMQGKSIDLSLFDNFDASDTLSKLQNVEKQVAEGSITWQDYFSNLKDGQKWQVEFVQNNDLSKVSLEQVEDAQKAARDSAIAYNNGLKQMTLGAKAANVVMKGLAIVGNMLAGMAISFAISKAIEGIDYLIHKEEKLEEARQKIIETGESLTPL